MNFLNILNKIAETDPEFLERTSERRHVIKNLTKGVTIATLPFVTGALFNKAYGQTGGMNTVLDTLNFALTLEYLEATFYQMALDSSGLIPSGDARNAIQTIADDEAAHVSFLKNAITGAGGTPVDKPNFDFSGGKGSNNGPFKGVFSNYDLFLAVAQAFEDTGVRAYKGQATNLMSNNDVLTAALQIHSVEARHAAHIRSMRRAKGGSLVSGEVKPWIVGSNSNINSPAVDPIYAGEGNTTQAGVKIVQIGGEAISSDEASAAFDEPLTKEEVLSVASLFLVS